MKRLAAARSAGRRVASFRLEFPSSLGALLLRQALDHCVDQALGLGVERRWAPGAGGRAVPPAERAPRLCSLAAVTELDVGAALVDCSATRSRGPTVTRARRTPGSAPGTCGTAACSGRAGRAGTPASAARAGMRAARASATRASRRRAGRRSRPGVSLHSDSTRTRECWPQCEQCWPVSTSPQLRQFSVETAPRTNSSRCGSTRRSAVKRSPKRATPSHASAARGSPGNRRVRGVLQAVLHDAADAAGRCAAGRRGSPRSGTRRTAACRRRDRAARCRMARRLPRRPRGSPRRGRSCCRGAAARQTG